MNSLNRFVEPLLLFTLRERGSAHGYELLTGLQGHELTGVPIDGPALYRTLRVLERNGHVTSAWQTGRGPARRAYRLTAKGNRHLLEWRGVLAALQASLAGFVAAIDAERPEPPSPAPRSAPRRVAVGRGTTAGRRAPTGSGRTRAGQGSAVRETP
ncbi:MAG: PadR family transcriptional regulator [Candidatus Riflebacteria bacterium]|nr:PadR family transcriptional regulator [Candidatus Riflebacteria bacterium]